MEKKPEITKSMMIALVVDDKKKVDRFVNHKGRGRFIEESELPLLQNYIIPLHNFYIEEKDDKFFLHLPNVPADAKKQIQKHKKYRRMAVSLTDDPRVEWACDWSDLGCFRMNYKIFGPKLSWKGNHLIVEALGEKGVPNKWEKDLTVPDKRAWV